ncbi:MAG: endonuclease/exonuclease/phosphatase family protein [Kiloniellaceae bacterium]
MPEVSGPSTARLRVLTWNIHACVGTDGRHDVERVGTCVRALAPDIAAFQEVDSRRRNENAANVYEVLRGEVGEHGHDAWAISGEDGHYGQILASRFPLEDKQVYDISVPGREPRRILEARVHLPTATLRIIATHFGLRRTERRRQLAALREIVCRDLSSPILLLGDFNEWCWPRWAQRDLAALFGYRSHHASFPSRFPLFALDRIWCRPGDLLACAWAAKEARAASDHLPVVAELTLPVPRPRPCATD